MFSRVGSALNRASSLTPSGGVGGEQVDAQPARTHQHQLAGPLGMVQREAHRGAAASGANQRCAFDAEVVEQCEHGLRAVAVVLLVFGVLVGVPVPGWSIAMTWKCCASTAMLRPKFDQLDAPGRRRGSTTVGPLPASW